MAVTGFSGMLGGLTGIMMLYPLDVLRRLMHLNGSKGHEYLNIRDAISQTLKQKGIRGLYVGFRATLTKTIPMSIILFTLNDSLKQKLT